MSVLCVGPYGCGGDQLSRRSESWASVQEVRSFRKHSSDFDPPQQPQQLAQSLGRDEALECFGLGSMQPASVF